MPQNEGMRFEWTDQEHAPESLQTVKVRDFVKNVWSIRGSLDTPEGREAFDRLCEDVGKDEFDEGFRQGETEAYQWAFEEIVSPENPDLNLVSATIDLLYILQGRVGEDGSRAAHAVKEPLQRFIESPRANYLLSIQAKETIRQESLFLEDEALDHTLPIRGGKRLFKFGDRLFECAEDDGVRVNAVINGDESDVERERELREISSLRSVAIRDLLTDSDQALSDTDIEKQVVLFQDIFLQPYILRGIEADFAHLSSDDRFNDTFNQQRVESRSKSYLKIHELSTQELFYLIRFLMTKSQREVTERLKPFAEKFGQDGLRTFLSTGDDLSFGEDILDVSERMPEDSVRALFAKYAEIVDAAQSSAAYLVDNFPAGAASIISEEKITRQLLSKGKELLARYEKGDVPEKIPEELDNIKADILLFGAALKTAGEHEQIKFEDVKGTEIASLQTKEIPPADREAMIALFKQIRENDKYSPEHLAALEQGFREALEKNIGRFYVAKYNGTVLAFVRFEDLPNGNVYAGSFTASQDVRGSTIGSALIEEAFMRENADRTLEAVVFSGNPRLMEYHTKVLGHEILRDKTLKIGDATYFKMIRRPQGATKSLAA
ncbi:MAG: hypothetical protein COU11_04630 [Candidatus Harrisonbacteria bacterium CG10_big_fil_rev_8_21_14_0_10_49_15]|uniref:N-acetyltransferase domain-containing protein n=1 Tax=Candidatus Harrisonbacteria bacterium CG10_big_fil_rev_8_21_14_0_10_49_15 TaxID=1974587 RepID=A0A2H0UK37_9BACT|nr:MAG: hypothetical protein COU11_04630 [Candidatus Harrisonbacteria bacterium CG10_big_fil_rev_8_21_14_0_10_49_15]